ncbi:hypothetical protein EJB05_31812 [Eragrostis curvula]|uniref:SIAH-type domain-containing protein n=1 Tax=Eragrostis curvula TaxID=38414 RepID=A0A5J9UFZ0_9POAL|nr:hypothetical protein EJB05_31812 [Eragrostis curvula]
MGSVARGGVEAREELQLLDLFPLVHHEEQEGEVVVHQEEQETEPDKAAAVQEAGAIVPVEAPAMAAPAPAHADKMRPVLVDKARFSCSLCSGFLKRPIYQCAAGHMVCCSCRFKFRGNGCRRCCDRGVVSAYTICPGLGYFFGGLQVPCPNEPYGCKTYSPYFKADDHERACEHAPCRCAEQGCGFAGSPPALLAHLTGDHFWAAHEMPGFGASLTLRVPGLPASAAQDRLLFVVEEEEGDRRVVFVLCVRSRGEGGAAVSVACVRANAEAGPQYMCELWAQAPAPPGSPEGVARRVGIETDVASCAAPPGEAAVEEGSWLWLDVAPEMMHGTGASKVMQLSILIDKL